MIRPTLISCLIAAAAPLPAAALTPAARLPVHELAAPDVQAHLAQRPPAARGGPVVVALPIAADFGPHDSGTWDIDAAGQAVWRVVLRSAGARRLSATLHDVVLPPGAWISAYHPDGSQRRGPYLATDLREGKLALPMVAGDTLVLEARVPAALRDGLAFRLRRVNYGLRDEKSEGGAAKAFTLAGPCNVDVACPAGDAWSAQIRSVAGYSVEQTHDTLECSGTLVNNTARDGRPLLLTADHCFRDAMTGAESGDPATIVVYWNRQAASCGGTAGADALADNQTGATLLARNEGLFGGDGSDMLLLQLASVPSAAFKVHYAGWDNRSAAPTGVTGIHHPLGDQKAISVENDATRITAYQGEAADAAAKFLRIADWDVGVTEPGSSGSGLWSNATGLLVGTLAGGSASCNGNTDNNLPDWYGRMHSHFFASTLPSRSVKTFLDPANTGEQTLPGADNPAATPPPAPPPAGGGGDGGGSFGWLSLLVLAAAGLRRRAALLAAVVLAACQTAPAMDPPLPGKVTDLPAFEAFIARQPDVEAFRQRYPDVRLVLPGEPASKELRRDHSRYFAELDDSGRITGGKFR